MNLLPLHSVFSSHGIIAMIEPGQNYLPDCFILSPESRWSFSLTLIGSFSLTALSLSRVQPVVSPSLALARSQSDGNPSAFLTDWSTVE